MIPALSIRQPWAWLIVHGYKDIENRNWHTSFRGNVLVHAGLTMTRAYYDQITEELENACVLPVSGLPPYEKLMRGGLVGWTRIVDCVDQSASKWKQEGSFGFVLRDSRPIAFTPWKGRLQFFNVPKHALEADHETR